MARPVRGCPTTRSQQEDAEEPVRDPQQEEQSDDTGDEVMADYDPDVDYEGSEPLTQEQKEVDSNAEYAKMEMPRDGTLHQRLMPLETYMGNLWVHKA